MLRDVLNDYLDGNTNKTADDLPVSKAFCREAIETMVISNMRGGGEVLHGAEVIDSDPLVTDVEQEHILTEVETYDCEAFFLVPYRGDRVGTYIPVTPDPSPLMDIAESSTLYMYANRGRKHPQQLLDESKEKADLVLSGSDLRPDSLMNLPYWAKQIIEQGHRYIYDKLLFLNRLDHDEYIKRMEEMHGQDVNTESEQVDVTLSLGGCVVRAVLTDELNVERKSVALPIKVTFGPNGNPVYPMQQSKEMMGPIPNAVTSETRFNAYPRYHEELKDRSKDPEQIRSNITAEVANEIVSQYEDSIAPELLPSNMAKLLEEHRNDSKDSS